jgi:branched-chain amino acid transport system ATP-binding protein
MSQPASPVPRSLELEISGISAGYHGAPVVEDISITVARGEIVGILGPNGAGKSTTLRAVVGEIPLLAGAVHWPGWTARPRLNRMARRGLGYIPEDRCVFPKLTVAENLRLGSGGVDRAVGYFPELSPHLHREAGLLSGGQQQMITLSRVLAMRPRLIVVDELSQGLAPTLVRRLFRLLVEAAAEGASVLMVEQQGRVVLDLVHRLYVMRGGRIVFSGTPAEVENAAAGAELTDLYFGLANERATSRDDDSADP